MPVLEETTLVFVSGTNNNNKFYRVSLDDSGSVTKTWGRVGASGTTSVENTGRSGYDKIIREKTRKGYKATETVNGSTEKTASTTKNSAELQEITRKTLIAGNDNKELNHLVTTLVDKNNHEILENSGGQMKISSDGLITTPLGLVSQNNIRQAKVILDDLDQRAASDKRIQLINDYLTLVPQKVSSRRGWHEDFVKTPADFQKQKDFLKQLEESLALHADREKAARSALESKGDTNEELEKRYADLFKFKVSLLEDSTEFKRIQRYFEKGKKSMHTSSNMRLKRVYVLEDPKGRAAFEKKAKEIGNVMELWHGTRVWNVLSILRRGLMIVPESLKTVQINGKMFSYGGYFSDQSTKSLNYSEGYWDRQGRDNKCYMFLADVAMGDTHMAQRNRSYADGHIQRGGKHHSIFAKGGASSVMNNEMIVWDSDQISLKYICEFER